MFVTKFNDLLELYAQVRSGNGLESFSEPLRTEVKKDTALALSVMIMAVVEQMHAHFHQHGYENQMWECKNSVCKDFVDNFLKVTIDYKLRH